jgi:rhodanese-related sulfurtransferase
MAVTPITVEEVKRRLDEGEPVTFVDARDDDAWGASEWQLPRAHRLPPDDIEAFVDDIPLGGLVVPYGTAASDLVDVACALINYGWSDVRPLGGGAEAWRQAGCPTESKPTRRLTPLQVYANLQKAEGD